MRKASDSWTRSANMPALQTAHSLAFNTNICHLFFFFNLHAQFFCLSHQCMSLTKYGTICKGNNQAPLFAPVWNLKWNLTYTFYPATCVLFTQLCFALSAFIVCTSYNNTTREVATHPFSWTSKIIDIYTHSRRWCPIFFFPVSPQSHPRMTEYSEPGHIV